MSQMGLRGPEQPPGRLKGAAEAWSCFQEAEQPRSSSSLPRDVSNAQNRCSRDMLQFHTNQSDWITGGSVCTHAHAQARAHIHTHTVKKE